MELIKNAMRATMETTIQKEQEQLRMAIDSTALTTTTFVVDGREQEPRENTPSTSTRRSVQPPPVTVIIADQNNNEDVTIKVMDEGGGIPRSQMDQIWSYLFTTADQKVQNCFLNVKSAQPQHPHQPTASPIAGLGYGLPMSRAYARYFGGDVDVISMEGYGTDAYVYLRRLPGAKGWGLCS